MKKNNSFEDEFSKSIVWAQTAANNGSQALIGYNGHSWAESFRYEDNQRINRQSIIATYYFQEISGVQMYPTRGQHYVKLGFSLSDRLRDPDDYPLSIEMKGDHFKSFAVGFDNEGTPEKLETQGIIIPPAKNGSEIRMGLIDSYQKNLILIAEMPPAKLLLRVRESRGVNLPFRLGLLHN